MGACKAKLLEFSRWTLYCRRTLRQNDQLRDSWSIIDQFLVACTRLYTPLCPSVGWLVGPSVTFYFFYVFTFLTSLLLPKWSSDLKYGPCPPARDFGSRVSGLVFWKVTFRVAFCFRSIHWLHFFLSLAYLHPPTNCPTTYRSCMRPCFPC